jgi:hypothetical protein
MAAPRILIAAVAIAAMSCTTGASPAPTQAPASTTPTAAAVATGTPAPAPTTNVVPQATPAEAIGVFVLKHGFTYYGGDTKYVQYGVTGLNPNEVDWAAEDVRINITFLDANGDVVGSEDESIRYVPPGNAGEAGRTFAVGGVSFVDGKVAKMTVSISGDMTETDGGSFGHAEFTKVKTTSDEFGTTTRGLVGSTFVQALEYVEVVAIYRNAGGEIVGGDSTLVDNLPNEGTVSFQISTLGRIPKVDVVELFANP